MKADTVQADRCLNVYGCLETAGNEADSIFIGVAEGLQHWRGLRFFGRNSVNFNYVSAAKIVQNQPLSMQFDLN